jgi:cobalt/nickel transport system permease protein
VGTAWGEWGADEIKDVVNGGASLGFVPAGMEKGFGFEAIMPDYAINGVPEIVGYILSALIGVALMIILFKLLGLAKKPGAAKAEA